MKKSQFFVYFLQNRLKILPSQTPGNFSTYKGYP